MPPGSRPPRALALVPLRLVPTAPRGQPLALQLLVLLGLTATCPVLHNAHFVQLALGVWDQALTAHLALDFAVREASVVSGLLHARHVQSDTFPTQVVRLCVAPALQGITALLLD